MTCRNNGVSSHFVIGSTPHAWGSNRNDVFTNELSKVKNSAPCYTQAHRWNAPLAQASHPVPTTTVNCPPPVHATPQLQPVAVEIAVPVLQICPVYITPVSYQPHQLTVTSGSYGDTRWNGVEHDPCCGLSKGTGPGYSWYGHESGINFTNYNQNLNRTGLEFLPFMNIVSKGYYQNSHHVPQYIDYTKWDRDANPPLISEIATAEGIRMWIDQQLFNLGRYNQQTYT